eukprot:scaffold39905_cov80-Phaeocystis_antarctica.AAC.3
MEESLSRCRARDVESTATLPATSTRNVPAGQWAVICMGSIRGKTHGALPRHTANSEHTIGAMDDSSRNVQKANAHPFLRTQRSIQLVQRDDG